MGRGFFYGTDAGMATGSANFANKIAATPAAYGLNSALASSYAIVDARYQSAYTAAINPDTRTRSAVMAKNTAKKDLKAAAIDLARIINGTPTVSNAEKIELGLGIRAAGSPTPVPAARPGMDVVSVTNRTVQVRLHDTASRTRRGKPAGVAAAWVYSFVGASYPSDPAAWKFEGATTRPGFAVVFPNALPPGAQVWICAAWTNARQQAGPASAPVTVNVQGGGMGIAA